MVDPRALILETEEGRGTSGSDLNDLAKEGLGADGVSARVRTLLAVLAPPRSRPLGAQATRRLLVAVPADIDFGRVIEGRFLGLDLVTRDAGQEPLDLWLSRAQPGARLLEAVFDTPGESLAGDGR